MVSCKILFKNDIEDVADFVKIAIEIESDVDLGEGNKLIDGKDITSVYLLNNGNPMTLTIHTNDISILDNFKEWRIN